jgi:phosphoglycerate dehydrogenase-like enzyme|tara:strand:+ start:300 stop:1301 length:1002 start_codon:yes stop_codon:yes gene_type:complete
MKLLFLRPFSSSDTKYLTDSLSKDYEIIIPNDFSENNLVKLIGNIDVCLGNNISKTVLNNGEKLKVFQVPGAGVNQLDLDMFCRKGVKVGNSHSNALYVAEYTISLLFTLLKKTHHHDRFMREGTWFRPSGDERDLPYLSDTIFGKKLGFLGFGNIGQRIALYLSGFSLDALVFSKSNRVMFENSYFKEKIHFTSLANVLKESDVLFITLPLTKETRNLLSFNNFTYLNKGIYLINVSRAEIIGKKELYEGLLKGTIQGAALDVWYNDIYEDNSKKYPSKEYPFHNLNNVVLSPYRAGYVKQMTSHLEGVVENLLVYVREGRLKYVVNMGKGY